MFHIQKQKIDQTEGFQSINKNSAVNNYRVPRWRFVPNLSKTLKTDL